jgi:hypothetical protein
MSAQLETSACVLLPRTRTTGPGFAVRESKTHQPPQFGLNRMKRELARRFPIVALQEHGLRSCWQNKSNLVVPSHVLPGSCHFIAQAHSSSPSAERP